MGTNFITWTALHKAMLNALQEAVVSGGFTGVFLSYQGKAFQYRTIDELKKGIEWAKQMAYTEAGAAERKEPIIMSYTPAFWWG